MAANYPTSCASQLNEYYSARLGHHSITKYKYNGYQPITYTSLTGWLALNYMALLLLLAIPTITVWWLMR